jgi:hypothetical protein
MTSTTRIARTTRKTVAIAAAALAATALALPAAATRHAFPTSVPLPDDFQPEGIAVGYGTTFYVGSMWDGDIYRGNLRTGDGHVFIDVSGRQALGMKFDRRHHLLFVAGGFNGHAFVYDNRTGSTVADLALGAPGSSAVNDVALTRHAAYFTDSFAPNIYKVPIGKHGRIGTPSTITVTGPAGVVVPGGFGLNGIAAIWGGKRLLVDHSAQGILAVVNPRTGNSVQVDIDGGSLVAGDSDGLVLRGHTAWVVQNFDNSVAKVRLSHRFTEGRLVSTITNPLFQVPTAGALSGDRLALVNSRFDLGFPPPLGPGAPPGTEFNVVQIRAR